MGTIPRHLRWLHPRRTLFVFVCASALALLSLSAYRVTLHLRYRISPAQMAQLHPGMTREEVVALFGEPRFRTPDDNEWRYDAPLTLLNVLSMEPSDYCMNFSPDGKFGSVYIDN